MCLSQPRWADNSHPGFTKTTLIHNGNSWLTTTALVSPCARHGPHSLIQVAFDSSWQPLAHHIDLGLATPTLCLPWFKITSLTKVTMATLGSPWPPQPQSGHLELTMATLLAWYSHFRHTMDAICSLQLFWHHQGNSGFSGLLGSPWAYHGNSWISTAIMGTPRPPYTHHSHLASRRQLWIHHGVLAHHGVTITAQPSCVYCMS